MQSSLSKRAVEFADASWPAPDLPLTVVCNLWPNWTPYFHPYPTCSRKVDRVRRLASAMLPDEVEAACEAAHRANERPELPSAASLMLLKTLLPHNLPGAPPGVLTRTPSTVQVKPTSVLQQQDAPVGQCMIAPVPRLSQR